MMIALSNANGSVGTQINRYLDALGLPDQLGDAIGSLADAQRGNLSGAFRNLRNLQSGISNGQANAIFNSPRKAGFARGFIPRASFTGAHLQGRPQTYAVHTQVGQTARPGQSYGYNVGPFQLKGQISGLEYSGSFRKPVRLRNGQYLFRGRTYQNLSAINRDMRDGRIDGRATSYRTRMTNPMRPGVRPFPTPFGAFNPAIGAGAALGNILNQIGDIFGGGTPGAGGNPNPGSTPGVGGGTDGSSPLNDPNMTLEDKLAVLMSKLSEHLDKQIEDKMKEVEGAMQKQPKKSGGAGGATGGLAGFAGSAIGSAVGGPLGGMLGSQLGGLLGQSGGSAAAGGSSADGGKKPNLQLLQTQLQQLLQKRQQMFQTMSSILKSLHDTSMNAIRNLKA